MRFAYNICFKQETIFTPSQPVEDEPLNTRYDNVILRQATALLMGR